MEHGLDQIDWLAIIACVVVGQVWLTVWFAPLFGDAWAAEYAGEDTTRLEHTQQLPTYTYGIGAACVFLLSVGVAVLQHSLGVSTVLEALGLALLLAVAVFVPMAMPAYAFLQRWRAWLIGAGSQIVLVCLISLILVLWPTGS
ncbi:MAG: DUF1761 domain-containing protein [Myxococcales bacterium]|nr:DUF1761 domain-containing protein [Myxococcales bacterium]